MIEKYEQICTEIISEFCEKQEMTFEGWVGNIVGETAYIDDMCLNFTDIYLDLKKNARVGLIAEWHELDAGVSINYRSYIKSLRKNK